MDYFSPALDALFKPDDMVDVRCLKMPAELYPAITGRIPYGPGLVHVLTTFDTYSDRSIYFALNPVSLPASPMRMYNPSARKWDVPWRRRFLLDIDPERENEIATDDEFAVALGVAHNVKAWLASRGWDDILMFSSGNGVHVLPRCDLPNDAASERLVKSVQLAVSKKFSNDRVEIEVFPDADRLVRAYGSMNRKGTETETLKWRRSGLIV